MSCKSQSMDTMQSERESGARIEESHILTCALHSTTVQKQAERILNLI